MTNSQFRRTLYTDQVGVYGLPHTPRTVWAGPYPALLFPMLFDLRSSLPGQLLRRLRKPVLPPASPEFPPSLPGVSLPIPSFAGVLLRRVVLVADLLRRWRQKVSIRSNLAPRRALFGSS